MFPKQSIYKSPYSDSCFSAKQIPVGFYLYLCSYINIYHLFYSNHKSFSECVRYYGHISDPSLNKSYIFAYIQEYKEITSGKETKYIVVVKTGNVLGASTRAQIKIILCGTEGKTGAISLLKSETNKIKFQKGKVRQIIFHVN